MMTLAFNKVGAPRGTKQLGSAKGIVGTGGAWAGLALMSLVLAGCSLPSMGGLWGDDEEVVEDPAVARAESTAAADAVPGQEGAYPNLASVPGRDAVRRAGRIDRAKIAEGLVADRRNAQYTEQIVRRDGALARAPRVTAKPSTQPRTTAVLGTGSKPAAAAPPPPSVTTAAAPPPPPPPPSVTTADDRSGRASAGKAPAVPAVPAVPVRAVDIAPPSPPPEAPVARRPASLPPPPEATLVGRPAILPPPLPPPQSSPPRMSPPQMPPPAATNGSRRPAMAMQAPVGPLAGPPPPPPMLASPMPASPGAAAAAPVMARADARIQLASASVAAQPAAPSDQVGSILFRHGSTRLTAQDKHLVRQIAGLYRGQGGTVRVVGHASGRTREADPVRHQMINFKVSMQRANAVAAELRRYGVPTRSIVVEAKSNGEPKFQESMPSGEAGNRRADIFLGN